MSEYLDKDGLVLYNEKVKEILNKKLDKNDLVIYDEKVKEDLNKKQDVIIAGTGITIAADGKTISASGGDCLVTKAYNYTANKGVILGGESNSSLTLGKYAVVLGGKGTDSTSRNTATGNYSVAQGQKTSSSGIASHSEGSNTFAEGDSSHAEGNWTVASGSGSHAEGGYFLSNSASKDFATTASGIRSHAEGGSTKATGDYSHSEGINTIALGRASHAEGTDTTAGVADTSSWGCHAEGGSTTATGICSHAEGQNTTASNGDCHAEGQNTTASGGFSHAEGKGTTASGYISHTEGVSTTASGHYSHAGGDRTTANKFCQTAIGRYNIVESGSDSIFDSTGSAFIIGNGNYSRSNCFRVTFDGKVYGLSAFNSSGADYAEYFEWEDGNPDNEDRIGKFVSLTQNGKIAIANSWNDVIGVISGMSSIVGNAQEDQYHDMYVRDIYGRFIYEDVEVERETGEFELNEDGFYKLDENKQLIPVIETVTEYRIKINPNYDATKQYVPRSQRKEWDVVGLLGQVVVEDDGTCVVGMRCTVKDGGIATSGDKYRVIKRLDENHIVVLANFLN